MSPDGNFLATGTWDKSVIIWDIAKGKPIRLLQGHSGEVTRVRWSPDSKHLATGSADNTVIIWKLRTGEQSQTLEGHSEKVTCVSWSPSGKYIATGSRDKSIIIWTVETGRKATTFQGYSSAISDVSWSPDGTYVATAADANETTTLWKVSTGKVFKTFKGNSGEVTCVSWSSNGKLLATGSSRETATIWEVSTGKPIHTLKGTRQTFINPVTCLSWSPDNKYLATGFEEDTAIVWEVSSGKKLQTLKGHYRYLTDISCSVDAKHIATGSGDATTIIWNLKTGKEVATLLSLNQGKEWLVTTPDGYFDGSVNASKYVKYRINNVPELIPVENYRKQFERPGLLAKVLNGEDYRGNSTIVQDLPPKVQITSPKVGHTSDDGTFTITAEATSRGRYPVQQFRLLINGRPYPIKLGVFNVDNPKRGKATAKWNIKLEPGKHSVEVLAYTKAVFASSEGMQIKYLGGGVKPIELPRLYILSVGISKYIDPKITDLDFAHRDAEEVAKAFRLNSKTLFRKIETKILTNEKATRDNILDGLDWLRRNVTQKDFAVFFFAGHGQKDERDSVYFLPVDTKMDRLVRSAIDGDVLSKELESTVGQLTVILDACHSGAIGGNKHRGLTDNLLRDLTSAEKGIVMMCSATGREKAQESRQHQHGVFTLALLEALRGKGNGLTGEQAMKVRLFEGAVYFKQMDSYISDRVKQLTKGRQHPETVVPRSFRDFPVSKP